MINDDLPHQSDLNPIFSSLEPRQRQELERLIAYSSYSAGQLFHSPHEIGAQIFVLRSGRVRIYKLSPEGRALTLLVLEAPTIFGEMCLVGQRSHDTFAETMTESVVGVMARELMQQILADHPAVALAVMELMGQRIRMMENKLADIAFKSVPQRLASLLLSLAGVPPNQISVSPAPRMVRYTHQQLADMIGSYRETVTKAIGELREAGLIHIEDEAIALTDLVQLQRMAHH